jgi:hypothetical protein
MQCEMVIIQSCARLVPENEDICTHYIKAKQRQEFLKRDKDTSERENENAGEDGADNYAGEPDANGDVLDHNDANDDIYLDDEDLAELEREDVFKEGVAAVKSVDDTIIDTVHGELL